MPIALEPNLVGKRQDLQDMVYVADVKTTPGLSSIKKGPNLSNMLYDFEVKSYGNRKSGGVPDGQDVNAFDAQSPKYVMQARGEVFRRAPMVGFIAQKMSQAGGVAGTKNLYNEAKADQMKEHSRDMEKELWSSQDSRPDTGLGSKFRGLDLWTDSPPSLTDTLTVPVPAQTPANQIFTGSLAAMTEEDVGAIIQAKYENTGASSDLRGFVTPAVKNKFGFFSRYQPNVTGYTSSVYITTGKLEGNTLFGPTVDVYKSDWGTFQLFPVLTDFTPSAYWGLFIDMAHPRIRSAGTDMYDELPDLGGGPRGLLESIISVLPGDLRSVLQNRRNRIEGENELMANITIQAKVSVLSTNEQAGQAGFTHKLSFGPGTENELADSTADEDIIFSLFTPNAGSVLVKWALVLDPAFKDASDIAFNSTALSFGDSNSATRYLSAVQCNENGSEVLYTYGNTAYVYTTPYAMSVLIESMTAKLLSNIDVGKAVLLFELNDFKALADTA